MIFVTEIMKGKVKNTEIANYVRNLDGKYIVEVIDVSRIRTNALNRYYWGLIVRPLSQHLGNDSQSTHIYLKKKFGYTDIYQVTLPDSGEIIDEIEYLKSWSHYSKDESLDYIENIKNWASAELGMAFADNPLEVL